MNLLTKSFFWLSFLTGTVLIMWSVGYMLALFGFVLLPLVILHVVAGYICGKRLPESPGLMFLAGAAYLLFALARPDLDDKDNYTGITMLLAELGILPDRYLEAENIFYYVSVALILAILVTDILMIRRSKKKRDLV